MGKAVLLTGKMAKSMGNAAFPINFNVSRIGKESILMGKKVLSVGLEVFPVGKRVLLIDPEVLLAGKKFFPIRKKVFPPNKAANPLIKRSFPGRNPSNWPGSAADPEAPGLNRATWPAKPCGTVH